MEKLYFNESMFLFSKVQFNEWQMSAFVYSNSNEQRQQGNVEGNATRQKQTRKCEKWGINGNAVIFIANWMHS